MGRTVERSEHEQRGPRLAIWKCRYRTQISECCLQNVQCHFYLFVIENLLSDDLGEGHCYGVAAAAHLFYPLTLPTNTVQAHTHRLFESAGVRLTVHCVAQESPDTDDHCLLQGFTS